MAKEKIIPLSVKNMDSLEHEIPADGAPVELGDLIQCEHMMGFALGPGNPGDTITVAVRCKLVDFPGFGKKAFKGGTRIFLDAEADPKTLIRYNPDENNPGKKYPPHCYIGYVHEPAPARSKRIKLCFAHD